MLGTERGHPLPVLVGLGLLGGLAVDAPGASALLGDLLAQALVIAVVGVLGLALRRVSWAPVAQAAAGSGAAAMGLFWLSQRVLGG